MNFNDVLTQDDQNALLAIRNGLDTLQWEVGDIVNRNYDLHKDTVSYSYVCAAAGYFVGKSRSTIYNWGRAAAFYAKEWREKYSGLLTMEHYIQAMTYPDWQNRLERAATGGKNEEPMTVDQMTAESYNPPPSPSNFNLPPEAVVSYEASEPVVQIVGKPENSILTILGMIGQVAHKLHLSEEAQYKIQQAVQLLKEAFSSEEIAA